MTWKAANENTVVAKEKDSSSVKNLEPAKKRFG
jgi:hypothetical protein